jgi:hypothetical protein
MSPLLLSTVLFNWLLGTVVLCCPEWDPYTVPPLPDELTSVTVWLNARFNHLPNSSLRAPSPRSCTWLTKTLACTVTLALVLREHRTGDYHSPFLPQLISSRAAAMTWCMKHHHHNDETRHHRGALAGLPLGRSAQEGPCGFTPGRCSKQAQGIVTVKLDAARTIKGAAA